MVSSIQNSLTASQMGQMRPHRTLSDEQKKTVQDILSNYDSSKITTEDAKKIFKSFEEAGIRGGGLREVISAAGFDADAVWSLAHDGQKPGKPPQGPGGPGGSSKVDSAMLQTLQSILNQFDLSAMTEDKEQELFSQLTDSGLLKSGSVINLGA
jgi:hypothetical protein